MEKARSFQIFLENLKVETEEGRTWLQQYLSISRMLHIKESGPEDPEVSGIATAVLRNRLSKEPVSTNKTKQNSEG